ncbi:hypothetical protein BKA57DRAFT_461369 [Linnemannia elongata]|nr:hypothetical protein BKA57DRAFT_461369 [Linnemannia elongata]
MLRSSAFVCFYVCATFISFARATRKSANGKWQTLKDKEEALSFLIGIGPYKAPFLVVLLLWAPLPTIPMTIN